MIWKYSIVALLAATPALAQNQGLVLANNTTVDSHIDVPYDASLIPASGITLEAWITYDGTTLGTTGNRWPTVCRQNPTPQQESYMIRVDASSVGNRNLRWLVAAQGGTVAVDWAFTQGALSTWTHVAGTYDGTTARLFVNGVEMNQGFTSGPILNRGGPLRIGNGDVSTPGAEVWNGEIDEVRIWPFARTAAKITATMNQELMSMPGGVSTWNLNGTEQDSSGTNHGTPVGNLAYNNPNGLTLTSFASPGAATYGAATAACQGPPVIAIAALPQVGNLAFGLACTSAPANLSGLVFFSAVPLTTPLPILGIDLWVDITNPASFLLFGSSNVLGAGRVTVPIPNDSFFALNQLSVQFVWADPPCSVNLLSASEGMSLLILP